MKSAVLVIDVQAALCAGEYAAFEAERVIQRINSVTRKARAAAVPVVFIQHQSQGGVLEFQSDGWKLAPGLEALPDDMYVQKKATDSFHETELGELLERFCITELVICGLQSEFCVDTTVRRSLALGYPVVLVEDGHSTMNNGILNAEQISAHHTLTLVSISSFGPRVRAIPACKVAFVA